MSDAAEALRSSNLFEDATDKMIEDISALMGRVNYRAGEIVFNQGDQGESLVLIDSGKLESLLAVPGREPRKLGDVVPGDVVGELSLLGAGRRTATIRAVEPSSGWSLARASFDVLKHDARSSALMVTRTIGSLAAERLNGLLVRTAEELEGVPTSEPRPGVWLVRADAEPADYMNSLLFFQDFHNGEVEHFLSDLRWFELQRGSVLVPRGESSPALWIVARGAIETTMRGEHKSRRLRIAGPGRTVGHLGVPDRPDVKDRLERVAREKTILVEVPWERVEQLLEGQDRTSRLFASALWTDTVRALENGERPLARMLAAN